MNHQILEKDKLNKIIPKREKIMEKVIERQIYYKKDPVIDRSSKKNSEEIFESIHYDGKSTRITNSIEKNSQTENSNFIFINSEIGENKKFSEETLKNFNKTEQNEERLKTLAKLRKIPKCENFYCKYKLKSANRLTKCKFNEEVKSLCKNCCRAFEKNQFCDHCSQIYLNTGAYSTIEDNKAWIRCDYCKKWLHLECVENHENKNNLKERKKYFCPKCTKNKKNHLIKNNSKKQNQKIIEKKNKIPQSKNNDLNSNNTIEKRIKLNPERNLPIFKDFSKTKINNSDLNDDSFKNLEYLMKFHGKSLKLTQKDIESDLNLLKQIDLNGKKRIVKH